MRQQTRADQTRAEQERSVCVHDRPEDFLLQAKQKRPKTAKNGQKRLFLKLVFSWQKIGLPRQARDKRKGQLETG
jgi:hypothetical protein